MLGKRISLLLVCVLLLAAACVPIQPNATDQSITRTAGFEELVRSSVSAFQTQTAITLPTVSVTPFPIFPPVLATDVPVQAPTNTPTFESTQQLNSGWSSILLRMQAYGNVQQDYLSDDYRALLERRLALYGPAHNILTLELHGDNYDMYEGRYSLTPELFYSQIDTLMSQEYHFATLHEVEGFVQGWFPLPARSVILTTDISSQTVDSLYSITHTFQALEAIYGYKPHMLVFPWTGDMAERPGVACEADSCWQALNDANASGYFTFGSHSTAHPDFGTLTTQQTVEDLQQSKNDIAEHLGLWVYVIAWPFEVCSADVDAVVNLGFMLAWGGSTKPLSINYTAWLDPRPFV